MNSLLIDTKDNVAVVTSPVVQGMNVNYLKENAELQIAARTAIPIYHKIALCDIETGQKIIKYGHIIGKATQNIRTGEHVHCHNVVSAVESEH